MGRNGEMVGLEKPGDAARVTKRCEEGTKRRERDRGLSLAASSNVYFDVRLLLLSRSNPALRAFLSRGGTQSESGFSRFTGIPAFNLPETQVLSSRSKLPDLFDTNRRNASTRSLSRTVWWQNSLSAEISGLRGS
jgi:hypothetical protein